jgi:hypothetical protein
LKAACRSGGVGCLAQQLKAGDLMVQHPTASHNSHYQHTHRVIATPDMDGRKVAERVASPVQAACVSSELACPISLIGVAEPSLLACALPYVCKWRKPQVTRSNTCAIH